MRKSFLLLFVFIFMPAFAQSPKMSELLKNAFMSADSTDYYFKLAKRAIKDDKDLAEYYFCKNAWHSDHANVDSTAYWGEKAAAKFIKHKAYLKLMYVYNNLGKAYSRAGEYEKAIAVDFKGLKVAESIGDKYWVGQFYLAISTSYHDFEDFQKGIVYGKKSLKAFLSDTKNSDPLLAARALNAIGINFDDWNKPDSALAYHFKVFKYVKGKDTLKLNSSYNNIGNTLLKQKKYHEARKWVENSLKVLLATTNDRTELQNHYEKATNYTNLATIAFQLNEFSNAENYFRMAFEAATNSKDVEKMRDYYYQQYQFSKKKKDFAKASEFQDQYIMLRDSVFDIERAENLAGLEARYQNEKKEKELFKSKAAIVEAEQAMRKKNMQFVILALISFALVLISWLIYRQQKLKNRQQAQEHKLKTAISQIETQSKLQDQRLAISRDLHDNIGAQLTFIISSVDNIKYAFDIANTKLDHKLSSISTFAKDTIVELRDTIWAMNNTEITFEDLRARIMNFMDKAKEARENINFKFVIDDDLSAENLSSIVGMNIYRTTQEAVNNALKYAHATEIEILINRIGETINISIADNGLGYDAKFVEKGNGLRNMEQRITDIGGTISMESVLDKGTTITVILPESIANTTDELIIN